MAEQMSEEERHRFHECESCHYPPDLACQTYLVGANGTTCVYCDHEERCHPGPDLPGVEPTGP